MTTMKPNLPKRTVYMFADNYGNLHDVTDHVGEGIDALADYIRLIDPTCGCAKEIAVSIIKSANKEN